MTMTRFIGRASALALAISALSMPATAQDSAAPAAADDEGLADIIVTARRREENLQDVPLTVKAFSAEAIATKGIRDIQDVARLTPGLFFDKGFVQQDTRPNIRGLPASRGRPPVGVLLDGIDISSESIASAGGGNLANLRLVDFERIEVVKGPQSALYGRVAFGGAINYITKEPSTAGFEGYVAGEAATYGRYEARGAVNIPAGDALAFRVNGVYSRFNGFYDNEVTGKRIGGERSAGAAVAAKYERDAVKIVSRVSYSDDKYEPRPQYYVGGAPEVNLRESVSTGVGGVLVGNPPAPLGATGFFARRGAIGKGLGRVLLSADPLTDRDFPGTRTKTFLSSVRAEFDLSDSLQLSTWTGYNHQRGKQVQDTDFFGRPLVNYTQPGTTASGLAEVPPGGIATGLFFFDAKTRTKQFSQEVRLASQGDSRFRWAVGGLYWWENVYQELASISVPTLVAPAGNLQGVPAGTPVNVYFNVKRQGGRAPGQGQGRKTKHYSGYALAEFDITDQVTISAEGRYAKESYDYLFARSIGTSTTPNAAGIYPFTLLGTTFTQKTSTTYFAPRVSLNYKPTQDLLFYASYSRGIKPAGLSQVQTQNPADAEFGTEKLDNYEAGFKSTLLDRRLQLNGSIFRMNYKDKQESTLQPVPLTVNPQGQVTVVRNVGAARVDGAELEINAQVARGLSINFGYTYLDAKYTDYDLPTVSPIFIAQVGGCQIRPDPQGVTRCFVNLDGRRLEASSRHSIVTGFNYRTPVTDEWTLLIESDVQYRSRRYQDATNLYYYKPYAVADFRIGMETERYSLIAFVNNMFDDRTVKSAQSSGDVNALPIGGLSYSSFAPDKRQFGIRARLNF